MGVQKLITILELTRKTKKQKQKQNKKLKINLFNSNALRGFSDQVRKYGRIIKIHQLKIEWNEFLYNTIANYENLPLLLCRMALTFVQKRPFVTYDWFHPKLVKVDILIFCVKWIKEFLSWVTFAMVTKKIAV